MRIIACNLVLFLCIAAMPAGCGEGANSQTASRALEQAGPLPTSIEGEGVVRGSIRFDGTPPEMPILPNTRCHDDAEPIREEIVVVNDNQTLRNVFVYVQGGPAVDGQYEEPGLLDQVNCRYTPRVVGVQINQPLVIRSSDPTLHNVHYRPSRNRPANFSQRIEGAENVVSFDRPEIFRVRCDVHPWMTAYIGVFENPFFTATRDDGRFEIAGVPDGTYVLVAWHEQYGTQEQQIAVSSGEPVEIDFTYRAP